MAKRKRSENATATRGKPLYELVQERGPRIIRGTDPIEDVLLDEERELAREHKRLRLEQLIEKRRKEVAKMREGVGDGGSLPSNTDFLNMSKFLADLSPEEAQRVRSAYAFFKTAEKGSGAGMNMLLPLINYAKENPNATQNQMVQYLGLMNAQLVKGMELMRAANPSKQDNPIEFLKLVKDLIIEGVRNRVLQAIKQNQPQMSPFEQILLDDKLFARARDLGVFGRHESGARGDIDLEIERLRGERMMESKRIDLETRKMMLEHEAGERRTNAVLNALTPLSALFAAPVDKKMRQLGRSTAAQSQAPVKAPPAPTQSSAPVNAPLPPGNVIHIRCTCGHRETVSFEGEPPKSLNCPTCGLELVTQTPEEPAPPPEPAHREESPEVEVSPKNRETGPPWAGKILPQYYYTRPP